jgi:hypothetical protein
MLWTLLLLQEMNAAVVVGDIVEASKVLELKLIVPMFFTSSSSCIFLDSTD